MLKLLLHNSVTQVLHRKKERENNSQAFVPGRIVKHKPSKKNVDGTFYAKMETKEMKKISTISLGRHLEEAQQIVDGHDDDIPAIHHYNVD